MQTPGGQVGHCSRLVFVMRVTSCSFQAMVPLCRLATFTNTLFGIVYQLRFVMTVSKTVRWSRDRDDPKPASSSIERATIRMEGGSAMWVLAYVIVILVGAGLIGSGLYYHLNRSRLNSDPVLIAGCYLLGGFYLASCLV